MRFQFMARRRFVRALVPLDLDAVACVEGAFRALASEAVAMPPILRLDIPEHRGEVDVKTAYVPGLDRFAIVRFLFYEQHLLLIFFLRCQFCADFNLAHSFLSLN